MGGRIVVTGRVPEPALDLLREAGELDARMQETALSVEELHSAIAGAEAVVTLLSDRVDDAFLDAAGPQLRVVSNVAVGYNNIDVAACAARGVVVTNTPGVLTDATADIAMALILMVMRRLGEGERVIRSREGWRWHMHYMLGTSLQGKTLGIVGMGQIGTATARRAKAFGMNIIYSGRRRADEELEAELGAAFYGLDDLLGTSDVVSLHCPLTTETHHLITAERLAQMRADAYLVNTTRGPVVDEGALAEALRTGVIRGAGLDVFEREPEVHPGLLDLENVVLIPHLGSATIETRTAMAVLAARNAAAVLSGAEPLTPVTVG
jgi:glyoxylate reductase